MNDPILDLSPERLTVIGQLLLFITGLVQGWWVLGREHRAMTADRDYWRSRAERSTALAEKATTVAERASGPTP